MTRNRDVHFSKVKFPNGAVEESPFRLEFKRSVAPYLNPFGNRNTMEA